MAFDIDPAAAIVSLCSLFDLASDCGMAVSGVHLDFPGLAQLTRGAGGYALEAD